MTIKLKPVKSSQLAEIGYDADKQVLAIRFTNGKKLYHYQGVTPNDFAKFESAESVGKHFGAHIRGKFPHTLQDEKKEKAR